MVAGRYGKRTLFTAGKYWRNGCRASRRLGRFGHASFRTRESIGLPLLVGHAPLARELRSSVFSNRYPFLPRVQGFCRKKRFKSPGAQEKIA